LGDNDGPADVLLLLGAASEWHPTSRYDVETGEVTKLALTSDDDHKPAPVGAGHRRPRPEPVSDGGTLYFFNSTPGVPPS
jgi:hypothetical protein